MIEVPQRIMCNSCDSVLYEGNELKSPFEIISTQNGKCIKCGRKLSPIPMRVDVKTLEPKVSSN